MFIQTHVNGSDVRILVIGNEVVCAAEREPAAVCGDGVHTLRELIEYENASNSLRGEGYSKPLNRINCALAKEYVGKNEFANTIPEKGEVTRVIGVANIGAGGTATSLEITDLPEKMVDDARRITKAAGLFICGVDFIFDHSRQSWSFIEMNSSLSFGLHTWPSHGPKTNVAQRFVSELLEAYKHIDIK